MSLRDCMAPNMSCCSGMVSESAAEAQSELAVRSLGTAITADGLDLTVDAHTGVACAPTDGTDLHDLVRRARLAMYKARSDDFPCSVIGRARTTGVGSSGVASRPT